MSWMSGKRKRKKNHKKSCLFLRYNKMLLCLGVTQSSMSKSLPSSCWGFYFVSFAWLNKSYTGHVRVVPVTINSSPKMFTSVHEELGSKEMCFGEFMKLLKFNVKLVIHFPSRIFKEKISILISSSKDLLNQIWPIGRHRVINAFTYIVW